MTSAPRIARVICAAPAQDSLVPMYQALGSTIDTLDDGLAIHVSEGCIHYQWDAEKRGVIAVEIVVSDLDAQFREITAMGIATTIVGDESTSMDEFRVPADAAGGLEVRVRRTARVDDAAPSGCPTRLDHLAIVVNDLDAASRLWQALTGVAAQTIDVHPASNGALAAARYILGEQMIELLSPIEGHDSAIARRLAAKGEGPIGLALPVIDLNIAVRRLGGVGVEVATIAPHVVIHPSDTAGVLVQLTPRVNH